MAFSIMFSIGASESPENEVCKWQSAIMDMGVVSLYFQYCNCSEHIGSFKPNLLFSMPVTASVSGLPE